jgi:hypothetical protein
MLAAGGVCWALLLLSRGDRDLASLIIPIALFVPGMALPFGVALGLILPGVLVVRAWGGGKRTLAVTGALLVPATAAVLLALSRVVLGRGGSLASDLETIQGDPFFAAPFVVGLLVGGMLLGVIVARNVSAPSPPPLGGSPAPPFGRLVSAAPCPRCSRVGHVRAEDVIIGSASFTQFLCHLCGKAWASRTGDV